MILEYFHPKLHYTHKKTVTPFGCGIAVNFAPALCVIWLDLSH